MEELAKILVNLESESAIEIANKYIYFQYVQHVTETFLVAGFIAAIFFGIKFGIKKLSDI